MSKPIMYSRHHCFAVLILALSGPVWAGDLDVSGKYKDVSGDPIALVQSGTTLIVTPAMKDMPEQARRYLGEIKLSGTIETKESQEFAMRANYEKTLEPVPSMKLKMKVSFEAEGKQTEPGLVMTKCQWEAHMIVFADGEVAGSENLSEKCVGLWKKAD